MSMCDCACVARCTRACASVCVREGVGDVV